MHVTSVFLHNRCHAAAGWLLGGEYYVHGRMVNPSFFRACPPSPPAVPGRQPDEFVMTAARADPASLIEADLLLLLNDMIPAGPARPGERKGVSAGAEPLFGKPWIFAGARTCPELPLFIRAGNPEGMKNLLASLGLDPVREQAMRLKQDIGRHLKAPAAGSHLDPALADEIAKCLKPENWHELA